MTKNRLAIITARGGSKRIPKKNVKSFFGKPAIAYAIETAIKSNLFDKVMVSTDAKYIADVAIKYGAEVPFLRSKENSDDFSTTADVLFEVVKEYEKKGRHYDELCCIYPCSMLINESDLIKSHSLLTDNIDAVIPVCKYNVPTYFQFKITDNKLKYFKESGNSSNRTQDIEDTYYDAGQFYWLKTNNFIKTKNMMPNNTAPYLISELHCQDIDDLDDWKMAEIKYQIINGK
jgi:N-acylneuraminate cytidylyltransferase